VEIGPEILVVPTWALLAFAAGCFQTARNGVARSLAGRISPALNSWSRFAFNLPWSAALGIGLTLQHGTAVLSRRFYAFCVATAVAQLLGNVALVAAFRRANFAESIVLHKLEVAFAAIIGATLFAEVPTLAGALGVAVCTAGTLLINLGRERGPAGWRRAFHLDAGAVLAITCGLLLVLASFTLKWANHEVALANPRLGTGRFEAAAYTLFHTTWIEVVLLTAWLAAVQRTQFRYVPAYWRRMAAIGFTGFCGSLCWFWAYSLTLVAYVKAVGQIEAVLAVVLALAVWREREVWRQLPGIACILAGIGLVLLG
jgi:drug/metabolite transporter (DMT)-like permease